MAYLSPLHKRFSNLHRIGRCPFSNIVGDNPQIDPVADRPILTNAADKYIVASVRGERCRGGMESPGVTTKKKEALKSLLKCLLAVEEDKSLFGYYHLYYLCEVPSAFSGCRSSTEIYTAAHFFPSLVGSLPNHSLISRGIFSVNQRHDFPSKCV